MRAIGGLSMYDMSESTMNNGFFAGKAGRVKAALIGHAGGLDMVYGEDERRKLTDILGEIQTIRLTRGGEELADLSPDTEVIFSTWGMPLCDEVFLERVPRLKAIFYAAGTVRPWISEAVWERNIRVFTAVDVNAIPVAEFALAATIFGLKRAMPLAREVGSLRSWRVDRAQIPGVYKAVVGVVALSRTGRHYCKLLRNLDVRILAYDPVAGPHVGAEYADEMVGLAEIFRRSDVVAIHAPKLPETNGLVTGELLEGMRPFGTFINTSRGTLVREGEMIEALRKRPDLFAYLDVTEPEPPAAENPLYDLPNVMLTPHIAGSMGSERRHMAQAMIEDFEIYASGGHPQYEMRRETLVYAA